MGSNMRGLILLLSIITAIINYHLLLLLFKLILTRWPFSYLFFKGSCLEQIYMQKKIQNNDYLP